MHTCVKGLSEVDVAARVLLSSCPAAVVGAEDDMEEEESSECVE